jgi:hypothetical protein
MLSTVDFGWLIILAACACIAIAVGAIIMITVWLTGGLRD